MQLDSLPCKQLIVGENVGTMRIAAERQDGRMLQQKQCIADEVPAYAQQ